MTSTVVYEGIWHTKPFNLRVYKVCTFVAWNNPVEVPDNAIIHPRGVSGPGICAYFGTFYILSFFLIPIMWPYLKLNHNIINILNWASMSPLISIKLKLSFQLSSPVRTWFIIILYWAPRKEMKEAPKNPLNFWPGHLGFRRCRAPLPLICRSSAGTGCQLVEKKTLASNAMVNYQEIAIIPRQWSVGQKDTTKTLLSHTTHELQNLLVASMNWGIYRCHLFLFYPMISF